MKLNYFGFAFFAAAMALTSCNSNSSKTESKDTITLGPAQKIAENTQNNTYPTYTYKDAQGKDIDLVYVLNVEKPFLILKRESTTDTLIQTGISDRMVHYAKGDLKINAQGTEVSLSIAGKTEPLVLINPIAEMYKNGQETITARYFNSETEHYVLLQKQNGKQFKLEQKEASAHTAVYANADAKWESQNDGYTLSEGGKSTVYTKIKR